MGKQPLADLPPRPRTYGRARSDRLRSTAWGS